MHRLYENEDIAILWDSDRCWHARECRKGSPETFDPEQRPWVQLGKAENARVWKTVEKCPSGALSILYRHGIDVVMDPDACRSIARDGDQVVGECEYQMTSDGWNIYHTGVDTDYEGKGIAKRLVYKVLETAEKQGITVSATCSYAAGVMQNKNGF